MTITPTRNERTSRRHLVRQAGSTARSVPHQVTTALTSYVDAVAEALARCTIPVVGVEVRTNGRTFSGCIRLVGHRDHRVGQSIPVELHWSETTGWKLVLHHPDDPEPMSGWFLHAALVPTPGHVASFTHGLMRGEDLGMAYPARFRRPGDDVPALIDLLRRHGRDTAPPGSPDLRRSGDGDGIRPVEPVTARPARTER